MIVVRPPTAEEPAEATESEADSESPSTQMGGAFDAVFGSGQDSADAAAASASGASPYDDQPTATFAVPGVAAAAAGENGSNGASAAQSGSSQSGVSSFGGPSAFGFEGTPTSGGETDLALGSLEQSEDSHDSDEDSRPVGEKEWYVAIDDSQVGPIDVGEIEQRWDARELDDDSLAWKAGMADWMPIADIAELSYLITERPQSKPSMGASFGNTAATLGGGAAGASVASASFDSSEGPAIDWKPSAASALSSLVEEEIVAPGEDEAAEPPAPQPALEGMPSFGANDVFGGGNGAAAPAPSAPAPAAPIGGGWSVPETRRREGNPALVISVVVLVLLVAAIAAGAYYVLVLSKGDGAPVAQPTTPPPSEPVAKAPDPQPPVAGAESGDATDDAVKDGGDDSGSDGVEKAKADADADSDASGKSKADKGRDRNKSKSGKQEKKPREKRAKDRRGSGSDIDDVFKEKRAANPAIAKEVTKDDIIAGIKKNGGKLKPCLTAARSKGEILPGKYKFVLNWRIQPSGGVTGGKLTGPREVLGTSLPACFSRVMGSWKFPASQKGVPKVSNFPLSINVR
ncbi:MAG: GYF domain-containing protein [Myxococcota bacterium]